MKKVIKAALIKVIMYNNFNLNSTIIMFTWEQIQGFFLKIRKIITKEAVIVNIFFRQQITVKENVHYH